MQRLGSMDELGECSTLLLKDLALPADLALLPSVEDSAL
jgi:hypothetical protein